jgi:hypothetical protein
MAGMSGVRRKRALTPAQVERNRVKHLEWRQARRGLMRAYYRHRHRLLMERLVREYGGRCERCGAVEGLRVVPRNGRWPAVNNIEASGYLVRLAAYPHMVVTCHRCAMARRRERFGRGLQHGRPASYAAHGCRCLECMIGHRDSQRRWRKGRGRVASSHP